MAPPAVEPALAANTAGPLAVESIMGLEPVLGAAANYGQASDINDLWMVVGNASTAGEVHAVIWNPSVSAFAQDLGTLPGGSTSAAIAINEAGTVIVGSSATAGFDASAQAGTGVHTFIWQNGVLTDLHPSVIERARGLNNSGQVVGANFNNHAVVWTATTGAMEIGTQAKMSRTTIRLFLLAALSACTDAGPTALDSDPRAPKPSEVALLSVTDPCAGDRVSAGSDIVFPSPEYRTLQSAVCAVSAGGTIHVLAGRYEERITIWGKHVTIRGAGNEDDPMGWPVLGAAVPSEVVTARTAVGVIAVGGGGSLSLTMLQVVGGDAGILVAETAGPVDVKHARFEGNGRGILHFASAALAIKHTTFTGQLWNAISYVPFDLTAQNCGGLNVSHGVLGSTGNAGIYVRGCIHTIEHTAIDFAQGGGIVAIASVVTIRQVSITFARYFGIFLINTAAHIEDTSVDFTEAGPLAPDPDAVYGDAISLWTTNASWAQGGPKPAYALLKNNTTNFTDRVAFSVFGGSADLKNNVFSFQAIDIQVETSDGYVPALTDLGGNQCVPSSGPGNPCEALSIGIQTPPNMGGLE